MSNGYGSGKDTRQTALRDLYVKLGGNIADVAEENDINRLIRDLGNVAGGGGGGVAVVQLVQDGETPTITTKAGELYSMLESGPVFVKSTVDGIGYGFISGSGVDEEGYHFIIDLNSFVAETADDYPASSGGGPK